jgi:hypothetical protein
MIQTAGHLPNHSSAMYACCCVIAISLTIRKRLGSQATRHVPTPAADERALLMEAAQALVRRQAAALAAGARPGPDFELHLSRHCRSIVFHDLMKGMASWIERCRRQSSSAVGPWSQALNMANRIEVPRRFGSTNKSAGLLTGIDPTRTFDAPPIQSTRRAHSVPP